jgi:S1-C subfamily serine protease
MIVLVGGDIVVKADQHEVKTNDELIRYIREKKPGNAILLKVFRGDFKGGFGFLGPEPGGIIKGDFKDVKVTLGERPRR